MDVPVTLENIPFVWGCAFLLNIVIGVCMFAMILRRAAPNWALGVSCWIGWWSWASAFTLIINVALGTSNPFAYHQIGVFTESMTNLGMLWWIVTLNIENWYVQSSDWEAIEKLRAEISARNRMKAIKKNYEHEHND